jgi:hypothetical protein
MRCIKFCPSILRFWFSECCKHSTVYRFFASERREITTRFSDMIPNLANTLQLQMLASHCCKILSDGKAPYNELMLRHTRQCTGASCKILQILGDFEILTATNHQNIVHRCFHTEVLPQRHVFTQAFAHTHAFAQRWFYTNTFTHRCFTQGCFYIHRQAFTFRHMQMPLRSDALTQECLHTHVLLHISFDTE